MINAYSLAKTASAPETYKVSNEYFYVLERCATYRNLTRALLVLGVDDLAVIEDHSPATVAVAHTRRPTVLLGEEGLGVAEEKDLVALDAVDLAPSVHNPGVVARNGSNDINTLVLELLGLCDVGREMVCLASWGEGAGNGEEDDLLVCPLLAGIVFLGTAAGGGVTIGDGCPSVREKVLCQRTF